MARTDYRPNHHEIAQFLRSREMAAITKAAAEQIAAKARANMPRQTGRLAASVHVEGGHVSADGKRVAARVVADAPYAATIEFGNSRQRGQHPLRRSL